MLRNRHRSNWRATRGSGKVSLRIRWQGTHHVAMKSRTSGFRSRPARATASRKNSGSATSTGGGSACVSSAASVTTRAGNPDCSLAANRSATPVCEASNVTTSSSRSSSKRMARTPSSPNRACLTVFGQAIHVAPLLLFMKLSNRKRTCRTLPSAESSTSTADGFPHPLDANNTNKAKRAVEKQFIDIPRNDPDRADYFGTAQQLGTEVSLTLGSPTGHWSLQIASPVIGQTIFPGQSLLPPLAGAMG